MEDCILYCRLTLREIEKQWALSRNMEGSVLINALNQGVVADLDVVMESSTPMIRSARLNLTLEFFGNSINAFEFGGRMENMKFFLAKMLGDYRLFGIDEMDHKQV